MIMSQMRLLMLKNHFQIIITIFWSNNNISSPTERTGGLAGYHKNIFLKT